MNGIGEALEKALTELVRAHVEALKSGASVPGQIEALKTNMRRAVDGLVEAAREPLKQCAEKYVGMALELYTYALLDAAQQMADSAIRMLPDDFPRNEVKP